MSGYQATWAMARKPRMNKTVVLLLMALPSTGLIPLAVGQERSQTAAEAARLVQQLGAEEFSQRERATTQLIEMGAGAVPAVDAGRTHPDREIRYRCERIYQIVAERDFQRRLTAFTVGRSDGLDLPGWRRFRDRYGDDAETRSLFAEMQKAEGELLRAAAAGPQGGARAAEDRAWAWLQSQRTRGPATSLGSVCAFLFLALDEEVKLGPKASQVVVSSLGLPAFISGMSDPAKGKILRKMIGQWIAQTNDAMTPHSMYLAVRYGMKEGLVPAERILRNPAESAFVRQTALMTVAKLGDASHVSLVEPSLQDATRIAAHRVDNVQYEIQVRDVALVSILLLKKQDPKRFGFDRFQLNEVNLLNFGTIGFENEDKRKQAFAKYDEFTAHETDPR